MLFLNMLAVSEIRLSSRHWLSHSVRSEAEYNFSPASDSVQKGCPLKDHTADGSPTALLESLLSWPPRSDSVLG